MTGGGLPVDIHGVGRGSAFYIQEVRAVLVVLPGIKTLDDKGSPDDTDAVLLLIELFFTRRTLEIKKEALDLEKKRFHLADERWRHRYGLLQGDIERMQIDYDRHLREGIDTRTRDMVTANERLRHEVEAQTRKAAIDHTRAMKAHEANKSMEAFLSKVSHEFRTPLNSIIGFSDMMAETPLDGEQTEYLHFMKTSSHFLLDLVNDVLFLSKIELGRQEIENIEFNLADLVDDMENITLFQRLEKKITLIRDLDPRLNCRVMGDRFRLQQVLVNLMGNAIKFMDEGRITISLEVEYEDDGSIGVRFLVHDEGVGISEDKVESIFLPFVQVSGSNTPQFGGAGLGLSISNELVKLMGGEKIFLKSRVGEGSTFFFSLKFQRGSGLNDPLAVSTVAPMDENPRPYTILLVEDIFPSRKLVHISLARRGYTVIVAEDGRQAVDMVKRETVDMVLMDIQMPVMDGLEATRRIRRINCEVPIIAMTAGALACDRQRCFDAGMDDYIVKPIDIKRLDEKIEAVIQRKKRRIGEMVGMHRGQPFDVAAHGCQGEGALIDLDVEEAIERLDDDESLYREILAEFFRGCGAILPEIQEAFCAGDLRQVKRLSHRLKGTAGTLSANVVSHWASQIEMAIRKGEVARVAPLMDRLEMALNTLVIRIGAYIGSDGETANDKGRCAPYPSGERGHILSMLGDLEGPLQRCDPLGAQAILSSIRACVDGSGLYDEIEAMERMVLDSDFEGAFKKIGHLASLV